MFEFCYDYNCASRLVLILIACMLSHYLNMYVQLPIRSQEVYDLIYTFIYFHPLLMRAMPTLVKLQLVADQYDDMYCSNYVSYMLNNIYVMGTQINSLNGFLSIQNM